MQNNNENKGKRKVYKNYDIFPGKIRLITNDGKSVVIDRDSAIEMAKSSNEDLVQISYDKNSFPRAICKCINYGKMLYEQKKKEKEAARKSRAANAEAKEVCFSIRIDDNDRRVKVGHIRDFIVNDRSRVKVSVRLLRRESGQIGLAKDMMNMVLDELKDVSEMDSSPSFNAGILTCTLSPKKNNG